MPKVRSRELLLSPRTRGSVSRSRSLFKNPGNPGSTDYPISPRTRILVCHTRSLFPRYRNPLAKPSTGAKRGCSTSRRVITPRSGELGVLAHTLTRVSTYSLLRTLHYPHCTRPVWSYYTSTLRRLAVADVPVAVMFPRCSWWPRRCSTFPPCLCRVLTHVFPSNYSLFRLSPLCVACPSSPSRCFSSHSPPSTDARRRPPLAYQKPHESFLHALLFTALSVLPIRMRTVRLCRSVVPRPPAWCCRLCVSAAACKHASFKRLLTLSLSHSFSFHVHLSIFSPLPYY